MVTSTEIANLEQNIQKLNRISKLLFRAILGFLLIFVVIEVAAMLLGLNSNNATLSNVIFTLVFIILIGSIILLLVEAQSWREKSRLEVQMYVVSGDDSVFKNFLIGRYQYRGYFAHTPTRFAPWALEFIRTNTPAPKILEDKFIELDLHWWNVWWFSTRKLRQIKSD